MMSRELKLALILGFAAVMVVGVLISDHMSGARQARIEERTLQTPQLALSTPATAEYAPLPEREPEALAHTLPENAPIRDVATQPVAHDEQLPPPVELAMGDAGGAPIETPATALADAGNPRTALDDFREWAERQGVRFEEIRPTTVLAETSRREPAAPQTTPVTRTPPANRTAGAGQASVTHTVADGETLWAIAERYYGDGAHYRRIEEANAGRMGKGGALYVGAKLVIPGATEQPAKQPSRQASPTKRDEPTRNAFTPKKADSPRYHVVRKGETLGDIARNELGSAKRWPEIVKLNTDTIRDPDNVPAGVRLRLPEK